MRFVTRPLAAALLRCIQYFERRNATSRFFWIPLADFTDANQAIIASQARLGVRLGAPRNVPATTVLVDGDVFHVGVYNEDDVYVGQVQSL